MLKLKTTSRYDRDYRRIARRGKDMKKLAVVVNLLLAGQILPERYRDHPLRGTFKGFRECHIEDDWLLVYKKDQGELVLVLVFTGTHQDIFGE